MQGLDLLSHQVKFQMWMHRPDLGGIVGEAVMAFGENRDRVHVRLFHRRGEFGRVEIFADVSNVRRCMKIQMYLAKGKVELFFLHRR